MYNLAKNTEFLAKSFFSSSANVGPLMTNDDALDRGTKGRLSLAIYQGWLQIQPYHTHLLFCLPFLPLSEHGIFL